MDAIKACNWRMWLSRKVSGKVSIQRNWQLSWDQKLVRHLLREGSGEKEVQAAGAAESMLWGQREYVLKMRKWKKPVWSESRVDVGRQFRMRQRERPVLANVIGSDKHECLHPFWQQDVSVVRSKGLHIWSRTTANLWRILTLKSNLGTRIVCFKYTLGSGEKTQFLPTRISHREGTVLD